MLLRKQSDVRLLEYKKSDEERNGWKVFGKNIVQVLRRF